MNRNDWKPEQFDAIVALVGMTYKSSSDFDGYGNQNVMPVMFPVIPGFQYFGNEIIDAKDYIYDRNAAVEYARKWAESNNTDYPFYGKNGGDCTNFISQALAAGGLPADLIWRMYGVPFLGQKTTRAWDNAQESYNYFIDIFNEFVKTVNTIETKSDIFPLLTTGAVKPGDIMYFENDKTGKITHSAIITQILNGDIVYCQHSGKINLDYRLDEQRFGENERIGYKIHVVSIKDKGSEFNGVLV